MTTEREKLANGVLALGVKLRSKADELADVYGMVKEADEHYSDAELLRQASKALAAAPVLDVERIAEAIRQVPRVAYVEHSRLLTRDPNAHELALAVVAALGTAGGEGRERVLEV